LRRHLIILAVLSVSISGCLAVATPARGILYTDVQFGDVSTSATGSTKEGKACAESFFSLIAVGDARIATAKANAGITEVSVIDHSTKNILGIYGEYCTVVKGK